MNKQNVVYPYLEYYTSIKNEVQIHAATWINVENLLSEISQTQKDKYCMVLFL